MNELQELYKNTKGELIATKKKHKETTEILGKTKEELEHTNVRLQHTECELEYERICVEEHKKTEEELHKQAGEVVTTLECTLQDVQGLHAKIGTQWLS